MQGKTIIGYTLQRQLGVGGMAEVWLAENGIGKKAAVKFLLPKFCADENVVARFRNEAKVMVQLDHPNIRQAYDYGELEGRPAIIMEYLEGDDLKTLMKGGRRFTGNELQRWWNQIVDALNYTHAEGIVHRDIKPSNLFLDKKGNIKLLDFGIAKIKESISMTQTGQGLGTLMYMSPEQVDDSKRVGPQSDIYSLAVTFVHLLTGRSPYDTTKSSDYAIRKGIVEVPLDLNDIPAEWQGFLAPYLAKDPAKRPALRPFEAVRTDGAQQKDDDATTFDTPADGPRGFAPQTPATPNNPDKPKKPANPDKPKKKTALWIALGVAALAAIVLLALPKVGAIGEGSAVIAQDSTVSTQDSIVSAQDSTVSAQDSIVSAQGTLPEITRPIDTVPPQPKKVLPSTSKIRFTCEEEDATLTIDGKEVGPANGTYELDYGPHSIKATAEGYNDYANDLTVSSTTTSFAVQMKRKFERNTSTVSGQDERCPQGALNGRYTINARGGKVYFSKGNLQYRASTKTWRFAEHQWDFVGSTEVERGQPGGNVTGSSNHLISQSYDGWIDLFGWGTSGYHDTNDSYNRHYQPWSTSTSTVNKNYNQYVMVRPRT